MFVPPPVMSWPPLGPAAQEGLARSAAGFAAVSPSSAMRLAYSESNPRPFIGGGGGALGSLFTVQSRAMCPALPQTRQMMLAVKLRCSGQSNLR